MLAYLFRQEGGTIATSKILDESGGFALVSTSCAYQPVLLYISNAFEHEYMTMLFQTLRNQIAAR